ncbi:FKBP-type peptidyl-prolyl cis-trans isomerase [uncultured Microscilla sp.]|uniref:FKBP-type peptidyl-prolyl cis-trans isomerase n=1 Tax=uncultured Microscilla sp. TaxID=432653 RepID=UPI00261DFFF1|nr:FKBP-type peptidyl-prolyl cis-trans isomerase [uncultured Microscilla sp.]
MMKKIWLVVMACSVALTTVVAQSAQKTLPSGIKYTLLKHNKTARKCKMGDFMSFHFKMTTPDGKVLTNSFTQGTPVENLPIKPPQFKGDITEAFALLAEGDSALIDSPVDTVAKYSKRPMPPFAKQGTYISYIIKVIKVRNQTEMLEAQQRKLAKMRAREKIIMDKYIAEQKLKNVQATASGLHYVIHQAGKGALPKPGETVKVNYTGKLTNGKVFDTSLEDQAKVHGKYNPGRPYKPFEFQIGRGRVIKGWDEGIALLKPGAKATLLVPSYLGYGERGAGGDIPPNSVLVFEVELVGIKGKNDDQQLKIKEKAKIQQYLQEKKLGNAKVTASGLHYVIRKAGKGKKATPGSKVKVNYTGKLLNGKVFDTNVKAVAKKSGKYNPKRPYEPIEFTLGKGQVIRGWDEGITLLKVGDKATFVIPSALAYGARSIGADIPPNSVLVFEVELVAAN